MILGIGTDLVDSRRLEKSINQFGTKFINRLFSHEEQKYSSKKENSFLSYAKQFAAKEAVSKAFGTGIGVYFSFLDITTTHDKMGKPIILLSDKAHASVKELFPNKSEVVIEISITDEYPFAQAFSIIHGQ